MLLSFTAFYFFPNDYLVQWGFAVACLQRETVLGSRKVLRLFITAINLAVKCQNVGV